MGNICRSPIAQGVFENVLAREGLVDEVFVDSAGTGAWHAGSPPDERAQRSASLRGLDLSSQRARRISPEDCESFDYVLTMDEDNFRAVSSLCRGSAVVRPFLDFASGSPEREVPDPYPLVAPGGGPEAVYGLGGDRDGGVVAEGRVDRREVVVYGLGTAYDLHAEVLVEPLGDP